MKRKNIFVGIAENGGHAMTYKVITNDARKIICHSNRRYALDPSAPNLWIDLSDREYKDKTHTLSKKKEPYLT